MHVTFLSENVSGFINDFRTGDGENIIFKTDGIVIFPNNLIYSNDKFQGLFFNVNPETCYMIHNLTSGNCTSANLPENYENLLSNYTYFNKHNCITLGQQIDFEFCNS